MKANINGIEVEGTPEEIGQFIYLSETKYILERDGLLFTPFLKADDKKKSIKSFTCPCNGYCGK